MGIGKRIRQYRKTKQLTVRAFAKIIGISQGSLSDIENEKTKPSADTISALVRNTDINPSWLLTGEGKMLKENEPETEFKKLFQEKLIAWIKYFIENASLKELYWLEVHFEKIFPEFKEWAKKQDKHE